MPLGKIVTVVNYLCYGLVTTSSEPLSTQLVGVGSPIRSHLAMLIWGRDLCASPE